MIIYYIGLACLFTHELDAVTHTEWRLLIGLRSLPEATAISTFVGLHVPLFFLILWLSHHPSQRVASVTRAVVATFMMVHAALHFASSSAPEYTFQGPLSNFLIIAAGVSGAAYLAQVWITSRNRRAEAS